MPCIPIVRRNCVVAFASLIACTTGDADSHVYQSVPPRRGTSTHVLAVDPSREAPIGSSGPRARIVAVRLASTGEPITLDRLTESVIVTTLVSRGRGSSSAGPARLELGISGEVDTTLVVRIRSPVPLVVSHDVPVVIGRAAGGLPVGRFAMQLRLLGPGGSVLATSLPVPFTVRSRER